MHVVLLVHRCVANPLVSCLNAAAMLCWRRSRRRLHTSSVSGLVLGDAPWKTPSHDSANTTSIRPRTGEVVQYTLSRLNDETV